MALYWHVHHNRLFGNCYNYEGRKKYILKNKPKEERELRLRLMRPVQDVKVVALAWEAYNKAVALARETRNKAVAPALETYNKTIALAREDFDKAIAEIHQKECPDCPWNGETIFP